MYEDNTKDIIKAQNKDMQAMTDLIEKNSGLIWSIVKRFVGRGHEEQDLYQIGCLGFIKAIQRFDTSYETKMSTYAVPYIIGEIKRFIRDDGPVKISRSIKELATKINELQRQSLLKSNKELTITKIANELKVSVEDVNLALEATRPVESIYEQVYSDSGDSNISKIDLIAEPKDEMQNIVDNITLKDLIDKLSDREKQIILLRYYKGKTQMQVSKVLGITQVQVSRIEKKVLASMRMKLAG